MILTYRIAVLHTAGFYVNVLCDSRQNKSHYLHFALTINKMLFNDSSKQQPPLFTLSINLFNFFFTLLCYNSLHVFVQGSLAPTMGQHNPL